MEKQSRETSKYYWLKFERGFFKRHDIMIIERAGGYPNGLLMAYFYTKLLVESIDHQGYLRFSAEKPYNHMMLSAITGVDIKIVDEAMRVMEEWGIVRILEDKTIHMVNVEKMLGVGSSTERVRAYRQRHKAESHDEKEDVEEPIAKKVVKKEPNAKGIYENDLFNRFWKTYPRKIGKDKCLRWFETRLITSEFVDDLIIAINTQKKSEQWSKKNGTYIPHPYTWLNRGGWNDELEYKEEPQVKISRRWENFLNE